MGRICETALPAYVESYRRRAALDRKRLAARFRGGSSGRDKLVGVASRRQTELGLVFEFGRGVPRNLVEWIRTAR
jgi:TPR repeat protein